jgi:hypothetical protein
MAEASRESYIEMVRQALKEEQAPYRPTSEEIDQIKREMAEASRESNLEMVRQALEEQQARN